MKAIVFNEHGGPEVLRYTDAPKPQIAANEVLVRVRACALNHLDLWVRRGLPGIKIPLPHIPGSDISGEVAEVGALVKGIQPGTRVVLAPGVSCGNCEACAIGADYRCRGYSLFGYMLDGGCAEFMKSPPENVVSIPDSLSFEEAAAVPVVFLTAWHMLIARAELRPGETVLVLAAGSGVGTAAIQIAKLIGARVISTAGSAAKLAKARELGADETINHSEQDISAEVRRLTGKRGVDVVIEHVGVATWEKSVASLTNGGRLVTCGATTGHDARTDLRQLFAKNLSLLGSYMGSRGEFFSVLKLVIEGKLRPVIDRVMPLEECREAHELLELREQFGKIILRV
ncbi:MAG TPA: zinc-binding dehydrogenase [Candidatus Acidoferrales bacterium]|nr:zinc-binding dehydrogenase [Candidatus Acidoferrales bacterium]